MGRGRRLRWKRARSSSRRAASTLGLQDAAKFAGYRGAAHAPAAVLLANNGLHVEILIDRSHPIGKTDPAGMEDVVLEAAITTIQDCEDSVAAVDAADKVVAYRNWLGLMKGDLAEEIAKGGKTFTRRLNPTASIRRPTAARSTLPGRSLMLVRNVGHLMTNPAILDRDGKEVPEGIIDAMFTALIALHDSGRAAAPTPAPARSISSSRRCTAPRRSPSPSSCSAGSRQALGIAANTIKIGIMDEERRTTVNLKECIRAARERVAFINTGFLDRTGDEIHTSMEAGPMIRKGDMKQAPWISAYEEWNVDAGLDAGLPATPRSARACGRCPT